MRAANPKTVEHLPLQQLAPGKEAPAGHLLMCLLLLHQPILGEKDAPDGLQVLH